MHQRHSLFALLVLALALGACQASDEDAPTPPSTAPTTGSTSTGLPDSLFLAAMPDGVQKLIDVKPSAKVGDTVVFEARIGGRVDPFVDGRAVFLVVDSKIPTCKDKHDACKTPWDYCCEPRDRLVQHSGTVQIVDAQGNPMRMSIKGINGLDPMRRVFVVGTVSAKDWAGSFVVDATGIHIETTG